jgi:hypothetical protein
MTVLDNPRDPCSRSIEPAQRASALSVASQLINRSAQSSEPEPEIEVMYVKAI